MTGGRRGTPAVRDLLEACVTIHALQRLTACSPFHERRHYDACPITIVK
jgi:hypothetical protein